MVSPIWTGKDRGWPMACQQQANDASVKQPKPNGLLGGSRRPPQRFWSSSIKSRARRVNQRHSTCCIVSLSFRWQSVIVPGGWVIRDSYWNGDRSPSKRHLIEEEAWRIMAVPQAVGGHDWLVNSADRCRRESCIPSPFVYGRGEEPSMQQYAPGGGLLEHRARGTGALGLVPDGRGVRKRLKSRRRVPVKRRDGVGDPRELGRAPEREPRGELFATVFAGVDGCDSGQLGGSIGSLCQGNSIQGLQGLGGRAQWASAVRQGAG